MFRAIAASFTAMVLMLLVAPKFIEWLRRNEFGQNIREEGPEIQLYRVVAAEMGLLFQIVDDILDEVGEDAKLGKTAGKDARAGKATYTTRFGLRRARELAAESHTRAVERLAVLPGQPRALRAIAEYIYRRDR